ncbi:transposase, MuDR [Artemisia annua]|uniref:Transposase, MuDR n=1 Tax=Artemisia annua TaxID=35608 RepID=A0A2U1LV75_ARTAN|nr:transposase, MuDR [Artemisia annua]
MFTLQIHHYGEFTSTPRRRYLFGDTNWFDGVHCDVFSMDLLGEMLEDLGYTDRTLVFTHFRIPDESLDDGLLPLKSEEDVRRLVEYVQIFTQLELYIETSVSVVECEMMKRMMSKGNGVVIEEIVDQDVNDDVGKDVDGETGNTGKLLLLEWHKDWHETSQPEKAGPLYDSASDNGFPATFCAKKMIANHSKRLSDEFQFRRLLKEIDQEFMVEDSSEDSLESTDVLDFDDAYYDDTSDGCTISGKEGDLHTWISDEEVDQEKDVDWTYDPYHLVDVPEPEEMHAIEEPQEPQEPQEISDMFAEIDQALDELDDVVAAGEGTEVYALFAEPISFSLVPLVCAEVVGDGEQRVCDGAVIPDDQCAVVVGNEGCISVVEGDVIKDKVVAKQGDEPDEVLEKNGVGQDGVHAEDKFEDQGRSIKRRRLMADKKPKDDAAKKPKDDAK